MLLRKNSVRHLSRILTIVLICTCAAGAFAEGGIIGGDDKYGLFLHAMSCYYLEDYDTASELFTEAGNYPDAKKWAYYCEAIHQVLTHSTEKSAVINAKLIFEVLGLQEFEDAAQWYVYCEALDYELDGFKDDAAERYASVIVHDSIERYYSCEGKPQLIETAADAKRALKEKGENTDFLDAELSYIAGMSAYIDEEYSVAANYFCVAGNYEDAREKRWFCKAIDLLQKDQPEDAKFLFETLKLCDFDEADDWATYCKARDYEKEGYPLDALELYGTIFIHDSIERYVLLKSNLER